MSSEITPARLEELLAAATQGPWRIGYAGIYGHGEQYVAEAVFGPSWGNDAALIALSPALAARVIELEAENARLTKALKAIASHGNNCGCHQATFINIARAALGPGHD